MGDNAEKLSGKVGLDTTDFKTGLAGMNRELRIIESGFKASSASLGDWANTASGLEMRIKSLTNSIAVQQQKVAAVRAEYERVKTEKGATSRAAQDLEIKLNKETETLGKMDNELRQTKTALSGMGEETKKSGDQAQEAGVKYDGFKSVLGGITAVAKGVATAVIGIVAAAVAAATALAALIVSSGNTAANLVDMSDKTGISVQRLQELQYFGSQYKLSLDTVASSQAKLTRSMAAAQAGTGDAAKGFKELGVEVTNSDGTLRNQQDVFADTIDALGKIENPAERDALAMAIFGKSAQELNPLIKAGSEELARLSEQAHKVGAVMSDEDVAALEAFDDTLAGLKLTIIATLGTLAAGFLPSLQKVFNKLIEVGTRLAPIIKYAVEHVIVPVVEKLADAFILLLDHIDFSQIIEDVVAFSKFWDEVMKGTFDVGQWLTDMNWGDVSTKIKEAIDNVDWNAIGVKVGGFLKTAWQVAKDIASEFDWGGVFASLGMAIAEFATGMAGGSWGEFLTVWQENFNQLVEIIGNISLLVTAKVIAMSGDIKAAVIAGVGEIAAGGVLLLAGLMAKFDAMKKNFQATGKHIVEGIWEGISGAAGWLYNKVAEFVQGIIDAILNAEDAHSPAGKTKPAGRFAVLGFEAGMTDEFGRMKQRLAMNFGNLALSPVFGQASAAPAAVSGGGSSTTTNIYLYGVQVGRGAGRDVTIGEILEKLNM
jgi:hypothetical protein